MSQPRRTVFAVTVRFFDRQTQLGKSIGQGPISQRTLTVFELARGHGSVLATILQKPGRWVVTITIDSFHCARCGGEGSKYLQFMALEDKNSLLGECTSNAFLDEMHQLSTRQERALGTMGWHTPVPPRYPNWFFEVNTQSDLITLDAMTYRTLREVFGLHVRSRVAVSICEFLLCEISNDGPTLDLGQPGRPTSGRSSRTDAARSV